jgi:hypothetical protein
MLPLLNTPGMIQLGTPPLSRTVGISYTGNRTENETTYHAPRTTVEEIGVNTPAQSSANYQRGQ